MSAAVAGAFLGPALGAAAAWVGTGPAFATIAAACALLGARVATLPEPQAESRSVTMVAALGIRSLRVPLGLILLAPLLFAVLNVLVPLALGAQGWGAGAAGRALRGRRRARGIRAPAARPLGGPPGRARPDHRPGLLGSGAILAALAVTDSPAPVAGLALAASITFGATFVPGMSLLTRAADAAGVDGVLAIALANFAWALGHAVGSPFCGWLADVAGDTVTYLGFAALCLGVAGRASKPAARPRHTSLVGRRAAGRLTLADGSS